MNSDVGMFSFFFFFFFFEISAHFICNYDPKELEKQGFSGSFCYESTV